MACASGQQQLAKKRDNALHIQCDKAFLLHVFHKLLQEIQDTTFFSTHIMRAIRFKHWLHMYVHM